MTPWSDFTAPRAALPDLLSPDGTAPSDLTGLLSLRRSVPAWSLLVAALSLTQLPPQSSFPLSTPSPQFADCLHLLEQNRPIQLILPPVARKNDNVGFRAEGASGWTLSFYGGGN